MTAGANVNDKDNPSLETPLVRACKIEDHETAATVVGLLLRYDAAVDLADDGGYTPLMVAAEMGHLGACKSLLERSPLLDMQSSKTLSENAIYLAARTGHEEVLDLLIAAGA